MHVSQKPCGPFQSIIRAPLNPQLFALGPCTSNNPRTSPIGAILSDSAVKQTSLWLPWSTKTYKSTGSPCCLHSGESCSKIPRSSSPSRSLNNQSAKSWIFSPQKSHDSPFPPAPVNQRRQNAAPWPFAQIQPVLRKRGWKGNFIDRFFQALASCAAADTTESITSHKRHSRRLMEPVLTLRATEDEALGTALVFDWSVDA